MENWVPTTNPIVADTSVAVKVAVDVNEPRADLAQTLWNSGVQLFAPDLIISEFGNAVLKKLRTGEFTPAQAQSAMAAMTKDLTDEKLILLPAIDLLPLAIKIAQAIGRGKLIYDCIFVALAEALEGVMITDDRELIKEIKVTEWAQFLRPLK